MVDFFALRDGPLGKLSPAALDTLTAEPFPSPPVQLTRMPEIKAALAAHRGRIKVDTPFNVDVLRNMLLGHPNRRFVQSVIAGLREGFWPLDQGKWDDDDEVFVNYSSQPRDQSTIREHRDKELLAGRWSSGFSRLMPMMKTSPMFVSWQEKPRVITDHTRSGLNDGIPKSEAGVILDDIWTFLRHIREAKQMFPNSQFVTFKDDVAKAFRNLPAHPIWQLRQVVTVDGIYYINRRLVFGSRASPKIWCAVSALICWIAVQHIGIAGLHVYVDDFFGWEFADRMVSFRGMQRPVRQERLLRLWEAIGCPFEDEKQLHGCPLEIVGFEVDINQGTIYLPSSSVEELTLKIRSFLDTPSGRPTLRQGQRLAGSINWVLNVLPWGKPGLSALYRESSADAQSSRTITITPEVKRELEWLCGRLTENGIQFDAIPWDDSEADRTVWTDASLVGLGMVILQGGFYYKLRPCPREVKIDIFFLELIAILSAIQYFSSSSSKARPLRLLIWTDSMAAVKVFESLRASQDIHNAPVLAAASIVLRTGMDVRVKYIPGERNTVADALSRLELHKVPLQRIYEFNPPRELLPAPWNRCF